ncbi:hypothetical protein [Brevibacterium sp. VCM10]|uniref:hypothetical protein n=1 Tax=Brevibacterium sp. VCM10 TaxID=1381751 RepID=UPI0012DC08C7|nr:hypothetical protein [Brevibacterium sp. VCM10]
MKNTIYREEISAASIYSNTIKSALDCCLIRLCRGVYSVIRECRVKDHSRIAALISDLDWINFHVDRTPSDLKHDFRYQTQRAVDHRVLCSWVSSFVWCIEFFYR